jgi:coenzyme F420 hydrogenase subunit delta
VDKGRKPGEVFEIDLEDIPTNKTDDFSMHEMPSSNMLKELRDFCKIKVKIIVCQVKKIPDEVEMGLSEEVKASVPLASEIILSEIIKKNG